MKPVNFPESNRTFTKPQGMTDDECGPLSVHNDGVISISCWKMTWKERFSALFFGKAWLYVYMGNQHPPVSLWATKTAFDKPRKYYVGKVEGFLIGFKIKWSDMIFNFHIMKRRLENFFER